MLHYGGPLSASVRREFRDLTTFDSESLGALHVDVDEGDGAAVFQHLVVELGPTLLGIFIDGDSPRLGRAPRNNFDRCTSLRRLQFVDEIEEFLVVRILAACGGNLHELTLDGESLNMGITNAIADNCVNLEKLQKEYRRTTGDLPRV